MKVLMAQIPQMITDWTISVAERPVMISKTRDIARFGKPFSHPFLVLKAPCDNVISEIHSSWKRGKPLETELSRFFDKVTGRLASGRLNEFMRAAAGDYYPHMVTYNTKGPTQYGSAVAEHIIFSGPKPQARDLWGAFVDMFDDVNKDPKAYYRYAARESGFANCQIVLRDVLEPVVPTLQEPLPDLKLAQTGWTAPVKTDINLKL